MSTYQEAPASFNVRAMSPAGFEVQLTLRSEEGAELMPRALAALSWLEQNGFKPTGKALPIGNTSTNGANGDAPTCQYHGPMKPSKYGGWFCPKKMGDGTHCKEKVPA